MSEYESDLSQLVYELNRSLPGTKIEHSDKAEHGHDKKSALDAFLAQAAERHASDIILVAGSGTTLRVNGLLTPATGNVLSAEDLRRLLLPLLNSEQTKELESQRVLDFCFARGATGRFRANIHYQRGTLAATIRLLPPRSHPWSRSTSLPCWDA